MSTIAIPGIAVHANHGAQLLQIDQLRFDRELWWPLNDHMYGWRLTGSAQFIVRCARVTSGMGFVDLVEEQAAISFVEHTLQSKIRA
jgi:hypothetical protein